ncbi:WD domain, G-beta repeat [Seminavis robusta]|uniref:WD domain, G-beta repeat n=1 Tax=Seminavis robusta TaxID=568900 RepID=A0A9N8DN72_9STRA|nr:WD domain, G-beta repeat [Seminavis robusta]|eukprot:Sro238_g095590.1 WD domain, G-beta repeat (445) ;mRNA; r:52802-54344
MDLLGDIGNADQLTSVRSENAVLQEKVKHLSFRVKELTIENESLKAEVELYRKEAALTGFSKLSVASSDDAMDTTTTDSAVESEDFLRSGNGVYPQKPEVSLLNLHGLANPSCCALSSDETVLATGGADCHLSLCAWGAASDEESSKKVVAQACRVRCDGPVIAIATHPQKMVAAGCMDGSVWVVHYDMVTGQGLVVKATTKIPTKHGKYVKSVAWRTTTNSSDNHLLATASADGTVQVHQVAVKIDYVKDETTIHVTTIEKLHLQHAVESVCFVADELCCYAREKPYLQCFDTTKDFQLRKLSLNHGGKPAAAGTSMEDQHVSFAVMDMAVSPNGKYLALATDASRNIIVEMETGLHIRNLYGHQNDGFSNPKVAWSSNGQYLLGNTQADSSLCVWDISSTQLVQRYKDVHSQTIRDMCSSSSTDILVTTSFDKNTQLWFGPP